MTAAWGTILGLAAVTYALKAAGPLLLGGRDLPPLLSQVAALLPAALLAALVVTASAADGARLVVDARIVGVIAAGVALWRGAGFVAVIVIAAAATAAFRVLL